MPHPDHRGARRHREAAAGGVVPRLGGGAALLQASMAGDPRLAMTASGHAVTLFTLTETSGVRNAVWASSYE